MGKWREWTALRAQRSSASVGRLGYIDGKYYTKLSKLKEEA